MKGAWIARYEEGYVTFAGDWVTVEQRDSHEHGWATPEAAQLEWERNGEFSKPTVARYSNGKQEVDDVTLRPAFTRLGVAKIWRRLIFLPVPTQAKETMRAAGPARTVT